MELCPVCLEERPLAPGAASRGRGCDTCGGTFFSRDDAYQLVVVDSGHDTDAVGAALTAGAPTSFRCVDCGEGLTLVRLSNVPFGLCGACGGAWFWRGDVARLLVPQEAPQAVAAPPSPPPTPFAVAAAPSAAGLPSAGVASPSNDAVVHDAAPDGGRSSSPGVPLEDLSSPDAPSPAASPPGASSPGASLDMSTPATNPRALRVGKAAPKPVAVGTRTAPLEAQGTAAPRRVTPLVAGGVVAAVLVAGGLAFGALSLGGDEDAPPPGEASAAELAEQAKADKYKAYFNHYAFGGRTVEWWTERLNTLRPDGPGADARLYQLTVERAERAGLQVHAPPRGPVVVTLQPKTTAILLERLGIE